MTVQELIDKINAASQRADTGYVTDKRLAKLLGYSYPLGWLKKGETTYVINHLKSLLLLAEKGLLKDAEKRCNSPE